MSGPRSEYFVQDATQRLLRLDGPFAYPTWVHHPGGATLLSFARAHAFGAACGGHVVLVPPLVSRSIDASRGSSRFTDEDIAGLFGATG